MRVIVLLPSFLISVSLMKAPCGLGNKVTRKHHLDSQNKVLGVQVTLSNDFVAKVIGCLCDGNSYHEGWEKAYDSHVTRALYNENVDKVGE